MKKPTKAQTAKALEGSIRKWQKIVKGTGVDQGETNCPLCKLFNKRPLWCRGCPVMEKTSVAGCLGTSYHDFLGAATIRTDKDNFSQRAAETPRAKRHAQRMLDFLKGLRVKK